MITKLHVEWTVKDISEGFVYNEYEGKGLYGLNGKLVIQPEYQRNYIYADGKKDVAVIESLLRGYPLGLIYFNKAGEMFEVLDGQQRITSFGRFITDRFPVKDQEGMQQYFSALPPEQQNKILYSKLTIYICDGEETEIKQWFKTINIAGVPLNDQELLNAIFSGQFVTKAKEVFSNSSNSNVQKWSAYLSGNVIRQDYLKAALDWVSKGNIDGYMSKHRHDEDIKELELYFTTVIEWVSNLFEDVDKEMRSINWGEMYEKYHNKSFDSKSVSSRVRDLQGDYFVKNKKGIYEYVLSGESEEYLKYLDIRVFDEPLKKSKYKIQTDLAIEKNISNCPICATGHEANKEKIWPYSEMDADHVTAWSNGGSTLAENCQMLCIPHNRAKGNR